MVLITLICLIILFLLYFYRHPKQKISINNFDIVYSPAYGRIMDIKTEDNKIFIAVFLSPFDVHYSFAPVSGQITEVKYDATGKFELAYDLNKSKQNEKLIYTITNKNGEFKIYLIAGKLVRRIQPIGKLNQNINSGETIGLIHFGSRIDIIIPNADKFKLMVNKNDYVRGNNTILGVKKYE